MLLLHQSCNLPGELPLTHCTTRTAEAKLLLCGAGAPGHSHARQPALSPAAAAAPEPSLPCSVAHITVLHSVAAEPQPAVAVLQGPQAIDFVEHVTVGDFQGLQNGTGTLSLITNDKGGIVDDTVTTRVN